MALADIIGRIEGDAGAEARAILGNAEARAEEIVSAAKAAAARDRSERLDAAEREARAEGETLRANARLAARDEALTAKRALIDGVLAEAEERLVSLPAQRYARLIAQAVARQARGGDTVRVAAADAKRLAGLPKAVETAVGRDLALTFSAEPAPIPHGVWLEADRVTSEVSPHSLLDAKRDHLMTVVAGILFSDEKEA